MLSLVVMIHTHAKQYIPYVGTNTCYPSCSRNYLSIKDVYHAVGPADEDEDDSDSEEDSEEDVSSRSPPVGSSTSIALSSARRVSPIPTPVEEVRAAGASRSSGRP